MHLTLASTSPRRRQLLEEASIPHDVRPSGIDDGRLTPGRCTPAEWVTALAYLKAAATARQSDLADGTLVLGADTVCVHDGRILGQPRDEDDAERMLRTMADTTHEVFTGVALICPRTRRRRMFPDRSVVTVGALTDTQIADYLATGLWRGKAGAYNIAERLDAGWPITFEGTMDSIMGLPIERARQSAATFA
ncbi:MAG: Maf-like protein [Planctomycetota bacterium]|nr:MAG: Maf-like protein [Planctomycetota bacterium]